MKLRPYQIKAVEEVDTALRQYLRVILCSPVGSGKGFLIGVFCDKYAKEGKKILILSTRTEIMLQNIKYAQNFGAEVTFVNPSVKKIPDAQIVVAMSQTIKSRVKSADWVKWVKTFDLIIADECQECTSDFIHDYVGYETWVLGLSGSPQRYGQMRQLGSMFRCIVETTDIPDLIAQGYLAKCKLYSVTAPTYDDVKIDYSRGEYNQRQLARKFESKTLYKGVVSEWMRLCGNLKTIVFCVSSKQSIEVTEEFNAWGVSAKYVLSGKFDSDETYSGKRSEIFEQFKNNEFQVLVNCGVAVAGLDIVDIQCVVLNYATTSIVKYIQSQGRGSRVCEGKDSFVVLDCGANYKRLGLYNQRRFWSLWHDTGSGGGIQALKQCPEDKPDINGKKGCGEFVPMSCKVCPSCGRVFVTEKHAVAMHLEEVAEGDRQNDIAAWAAQKKVEGWKLDRIMIQVCLANPDNAKKAFAYVYKALYEGKTDADVGKYWWQFKKIHGKRLRLSTTHRLKTCGLGKAQVD